MKNGKYDLQIYVRKDKKKYVKGEVLYSQHLGQMIIISAPDNDGYVKVRMVD